MILNLNLFAYFTYNYEYFAIISQINIDVKCMGFVINFVKNAKV